MAEKDGHGKVLESGGWRRSGKLLVAFELAARRAHEIEHMPMSRALEAYALKGDRDAQLAKAGECWAVPKPEPGPETRLMEEGLRELTVQRGWKA